MALSSRRPSTSPELCSPNTPQRRRLAKRRLASFWAAIVGALLSACGLSLDGVAPPRDGGGDGGDDFRSVLPESSDFDGTLADDAGDASDASIDAFVSCVVTDACAPVTVLALDAGDVRSLAVTP